MRKNKWSDLTVVVRNQLGTIIRPMTTNINFTSIYSVNEVIFEYNVRPFHFIEIYKTDYEMLGNRKPTM